MAKSPKKRSSNRLDRAENNKTQKHPTPNADKQSNKAPRNWRAQTAVPFLVFIFSSSILVYFNSVYHDFVYDDAWQILKNYWITDVRYIPEIISNNVWGYRQEFSVSNYYRPAMHLIYMACYYVFGLKPFGFHLVNILFHAANCLLVYLITVRLLKKFQEAAPISSLIAALLFSVHPIHTEAVAWIAGLPDLSFSFFYLFSFYCYILSTAGNPVSKATFVLSIGSFFLATLCKEPAVTLPLILVAYDLVYLREETTFLSRLKRYVPYLTVLAIFFALRFHALAGFAPLKIHAELSDYQYFINISPLFIQYLQKLILPINLNAFYVLHPISSMFELRGILSLAVTIFFIAALILSRSIKEVFLALLLIVVPLLPCLYIPVLGPNTFAERYLYLPSFGFVLLIALLISWVLTNQPKAVVMLTITSMVITGLYFWGTIKRTATWKNDYTLFSDAVAKSPDADIPHHNLGLYFQNNGQLEEAIEQSRIALRINPGYADAHMNLGVAFFKKGLLEDSIEQYQATLKLNPQNAGAHIDLGVAYLNKGWIDEAIKEYQIALELLPTSIDALVNLGVAYSKKGWMDNAIKEYQTALQLQPDSVDAHVNLGAAFGDKGLMDEAIEQFEIALKLDPASVNARNNLAKARDSRNSSNMASRHKKMTTK